MRRKPCGFSSFETPGFAGLLRMRSPCPREGKPGIDEAD
jgi:hypothetical protein